MNEPSTSEPVDYRLLVDNASEGVYRFDTEGRLAYINRHGAELLGYSIEEMPGKHFSQSRTKRSAPARSACCAASPAMRRCRTSSTNSALRSNPPASRSLRCCVMIADAEEALKTCFAMSIPGN